MTDALLSRNLTLACLAAAGLALAPVPGRAAPSRPAPALAAPSAVQLVANARHPHRNVNPRNDAGNPTGDDQVDRLNEQQLDQNYRGQNPSPSGSPAMAAPAMPMAPATPMAPAR